jgi:hypothetical protein
MKSALHAFQDFFIKLTSGFKALLLKNKLLAFFVWTSLLLNAFSWGGVVWLINLNQPELIFRYNTYLGISQIIDISQGVVFWEVFQVPLQALGVLLLNLGACILLYTFSFQASRDLTYYRLQEQNKLQTEKTFRDRILNDSSKFSSSQADQKAEQRQESESTTHQVPFLKKSVPTEADEEKREVPRKETTPEGTLGYNHQEDQVATPKDSASLKTAPQPDLSFWGIYFITAGGMTMQLIIAIYTLAIIFVNS